MKVLFVSSGLSQERISPIILAQGTSLQQIGIEVDYFPIGGNGLNAYIKAISRLRQKVRANNYSVIHAHYGLSAIISTFSTYKIKLVVSFMGSDIVGTRHAQAYISLISFIVRKTNILLSKRFYQHVIVKSQEMNRFFNIDHVSIVPNGVNIQIFRPFSRELARKQLNINSDEIIVIFVSNPHRAEKNFQLALDSVSQLKNQRVQLMVVNDKEQHILPFYYNSANCLVLTSLYEGSPNVIKEAMACSCPIVSTDVGDVKWVFGKIEGCFISEPDPILFSQKIANAINYSLKYEKTKGAERINELSLDSESVARKLESIYESL